MHTGAVKKVAGQVIWYDTQVLPNISPQFFDTEWQQNNGDVYGSAPGRGHAIFFRSEGHELVLRPFRRGGLIGKVNANKYLRLGAERSRSFREYSLLNWMRSHALPVPRPVAARYSPAGLCYSADLITERIPQASPLADILQTTPLPLKTWSKIGSAIRQMHALGVDHSDLNCRNILVDAHMQVWLIDFDKCRRRETGSWPLQNLARLKRSLEKESSKQLEPLFSGVEWPSLLTGYDRGVN